MLAVVTAGLNACHLARNRSSITVAPDTLIIQGSVQDGQGDILDAIEISPAVAGAQPIGLSESDGSFSATLSNATLSQLQAQGSALLKFESPAGQNPRLVTIITIDPAVRGTLDIGNVVLRKSGTVKGNVTQFLTAQGPNPTKALSGAVITLAHLQINSDANGKFVMTGVPAGKFTLQVSSPGLSSFKSEITVEEGRETDLQNGIVLFPSGVIDGAISLQGTYPQKNQIIDGHPYRRSFMIAASADAEFVRFDADPAALQADPTSGKARAPWLRAQGSIDFDFLSNGDKTLYFQFSNRDHSVVSPLRSLVVPLDLFAVSRGFIINDGSGRVYSRRVLLNIDVPPVARLMRVALSEEKLSAALWMTAQSVLDFEIFPRDEHDQSLGPVFAPTLAGNREVFLQFSDGLSSSAPSGGGNMSMSMGGGGASMGGGATVGGSNSSVYRANALVDLFPPTGQAAFSINHGAMETAERFVRVDINVPPNAYQMRIYDESVERASGQNDWVEASPVFYYFFQSEGFKTLRLQFRDQGGANSAIYQRSIRVAAFADILDPFVINSGAGYSLYRDLVLTLNPPLNAVSFRVSERLSALSPGSEEPLPFNELVPQFPVLAGGLGLRTFYLQYRDVDDNLSNVSSQSIYVTPFPPGSGDFHINGGASFTMDPILVLDIVPPLAAREMAISETPFGGSSFNQFGQLISSSTLWRPASTSAVFELRGRGFKSIYIKFRSEVQGDDRSGEESPVLVRHILFDPLPSGSVNFAINGNATFTRLTNLSVTITAPATGYEMQLGAYLPTLNGNFSLESSIRRQYDASPTLTLPYVDGNYNVCLRVITFHGDASVTVCKQIELRLFESQFLGLSLNGEALMAPAPDTSSATITIGLSPPPAANWIRIAQQADLSELPHTIAGSQWLDLSTYAHTLALSSGDGPKRICAQYGAGRLSFGEPEASSGVFCKDINKVP